MGRYLDLIKRLSNEPERENESTTETTLTTEGGLWSYTSFLSCPNNCASDGVLGSSVEAGSQSQSAYPQLQTIVADAKTKTIETTKVGAKSASGDATLSYIAVDHAGQETIGDIVDWHDWYEGRAAIIEHDGAIPRDWAEGFARLHPDRPPSDVPRRRWQTFIDDCGRFLDTWGAEALALGWGPLELFGCDGEKPFARVDQMGLIWFIKGGHVASMSMSAAVIETAIGVRQTYRRRPVAMGEVALPWELTEEQARLSRNGALPGVDMTI